jgi:hypothetical protein
MTARRAAPQESISIRIPASSSSSSDSTESLASLAYLANILQMLSADSSSSSSSSVPTTAQIRENTAYEVVTESQDECCAICHETFEQGNNVRRLLHCGHRFHMTCIDTWFTSHATCPVCRHDIREQ